VGLASRKGVGIGRACGAGTAPGSMQGAGSASPPGCLLHPSGEDRSRLERRPRHLSQAILRWSLRRPLRFRWAGPPPGAEQFRQWAAVSPWDAHRHQDSSGEPGPVSCRPGNPGFIEPQGRNSWPPQGVTGGKMPRGPARPEDLLGQAERLRAGCWRSPWPGASPPASAPARRATHEPRRAELPPRRQSAASRGNKMLDRQLSQLAD